MQVKIFPYKRGAEKVLAMLKAGFKKVWDSFKMGASSFSHTEGIPGA